MIVLYGETAPRVEWCSWVATTLIWLSLVKSAQPSRPHRREWSFSVSRSSFIGRFGGTVF